MRGFTMHGINRLADTLPASAQPRARARAFRQIAPVLVVLALILFPFGWLGETWPAFGWALGWVFATAREHAVGHTTLFCTLGALALATFPSLRARPWLYLSAILIAGVGQEAFQLLYKRRPLAFDDGRDLATDLAGALLAFGIIRVWQLIQGAKHHGASQ